ncbi:MULTISPECIES: hypothetical protein [unclassified Streptomyces]|uniref:hypothetical protein n=1 Tax=unclassified Streptomyces TaxID=2593676 RepID=UPI0022384D98|nr:hypothetical protein [Streptomyces sp. SHP 1-2]MCW5252843.1 hypothetical protein [Streptomyces sp. SHP 1-2]
MSDDGHHCPAGAAGAHEEGPPESGGPPYAECVLCREPTEHPESHEGITLCPRCEWPEARRTACSG